MGLEQSKQVETLSAFSILSFHDSIEMCLKLFAEHKDINSIKFGFMEYWNHLPSLTLKESMLNLNKRRVNIKHHGLLPSKSDIEISRINTTDFFNQNVFNQLGVNFNDISLLTLINYENVRNFLEEAQLALNNNEIEICIEKSAFAFNELLYTYEVSKTNLFRNSPFFFGEDLTFNSSFHMGIGRNNNDSEGKILAEFVDKVRNSIVGMQKAIKIISFGLDYKRYVKFKLLTPIVTRTVSGNQISELINKKKWTIENCQYCIDFVLDSSLKLQEFDFDIQELEEERKPIFVIKGL
jgi:hypothetical protein